jgi:hypothetical protein
MTPHILTLPKALVTLLAGALFGFGLSLATMVQPDVVLSFLRFQDWGLMLVMGGAAGLAMLAYKGFPRWFARPLLGGQFLTQPASWNRQTVIGSAILVWAGVCRACAQARPLRLWARATPTSCGHWAALCWVLWPMA